MRKRNIILTAIKPIILSVTITLGISGCSSDNKLYTASEAPAAANYEAVSSKAVSAVTNIVGDTNTGVIKSWEEYEAQKIPMIAAIPDKNIFLYGKKDSGVILYCNSTGHFYNWDYLTPRFILPRMELADFDGDGREELAVILYTGSGTGYSVEELHMVKVSEKEVLSDDPKDTSYLVPNKEYFKDYAFTDYVEQLNKQVKLNTHKKGSSLLADVTVGKKVNSFELANTEDDIDNDNIGFGNMVGFEFKDKKILARFALGAIRKSYASPDFIGEINSEVEFDSGVFTLKNLSFQKNSDK
ncbi:hypothetical protein [Ruminiclostridium cellobioparum]|uniref:VCBS repeat-containing protein n=1 Tax=Ruminiclostridium cellobioparum subsp. termitidis CT1112 TaxID=1195236 RepID=S0FNY7_RUMCE|nr:hypothetical protein [Ruminiclostridium cellobioparum]EMS73935.1 hypothetical protein CTER_5541 [Ruminiclostridium cellobioparum subsp. termitidis CT1112]